MKTKLYAITTTLGRDAELLAAAANVGVIEEKLIRGFTEATLMCASAIDAKELEDLLRSKFVGKFDGSAWMEVRELSDDEWDEMLDS